MSVNKFLGAAKEFMHESHVNFWQVYTEMERDQDVNKLKGKPWNNY